MSIVITNHTGYVEYHDNDADGSLGEGREVKIATAKTSVLRLYNNYIKVSANDGKSISFNHSNVSSPASTDIGDLYDILLSYYDS